MKRIRLLLSLLMAILATNAFASSNVLIPTYIVNENFDGLVAHRSGWSASNDANYSLFGTGGSTNYTTPTTNTLNATTNTTSSNKNQGVKIKFPSNRNESVVYLEFDWKINSATVGYKNAYGLFLRDSLSAAYSTAGDILQLYLSGSDAKIHCQNINNSTPTFQDVSATGFFLKGGTDATTCNTYNASTITDCGWALGNTIHVKAILDFPNHKITYLKLTNLTTSTFYENTAGLDFLSNTASHVAKICVTNTYKYQVNNNGTSLSASTSPTSNSSFDNFQMYTAVESSATATVTINYLDQNGSTFKAQSIIAEQGVGSNYAATSTDKETLIDNSNSFYYAYDPVATATSAIYGGTGDTTNVRNGGSTINLRFKKTALTSATYKWTGSISANLNEYDNNFTTDDVNSLGYQTGNPIEFPETASNKTVTLAKDFDLGANNVVFTGSGYSFSGNKTISGTGSLIVNPGVGNTTTLSVFDTQTQGVSIQSGTASIDGVNSGTKYTMSDGSKIILNTGSDFSKAIAGTGTITIEAKSNKANSPSITGASTINIIQDNAGSLSSSTWYPSFTSTMPTDAHINVTTSLPSASYAISDGSLANSYLNLGSNIRLLRFYNQTDPSSTHTIGEITGESTSTIEGGFVSGRTLIYNIGGKGTKATFSGKIKNYRSDAGDILIVNKVGSSTWTLTGNSTQFTNGSFNVKEGKLVLDGSLTGANVPISVSVGATLSGIGTISGSTEILGILEGNLTFTNNLTLAGTTKVNLTSLTVGSHDSIKVAGNLVKGGALQITLSGVTPNVGDSARIYYCAGTPSGSFTSVTFPSGYSFNQSNGYLKYVGKAIYKTTGWDGGAAPASGYDAELQSGTLSIDANTTLGNIVMKPGSKLTTNIGNTLATTSLTLESDDTGTATLIDNGTLTGTVTVKQYLTGSNVSGTPNGRFWYVTSPVSNATSAVFAPSTGNKFWSHSEVTNAYTPITADDVALTAGKGYVARMKDNTTITYTGTPTTGDKTIEITRTGTENLYRGFNLIGNPYPSFARIKAEDNATIESSLWFRTKVAASNSMVFDTYNILTGDSVSGSGNPISGYIPPMQAFWVKTMTPGATNVTFKQAYRFHGDPITANIKLRGASVDTTACLRIRLSNGKTKDETLIKFYPNATDAFDRYDSHKMKNNVDSFPEIFTMSGNEELAINGMRHDGRTKTFALGFRTGKKGDFKLKVIEMKNLGDSVRVVLKDKVRNCEKDLQDSTEYDFTSDVTTASIDRFTIVITANAPTALNTISTGTVDAFCSSDNQIQIRLIGTTSNVAKVTVFNTMGQNIGIFTTNAANTVLNRRFAPGVYMVNVVTDGVQATKKVVVNQ